MSFLASVFLSLLHSGFEKTHLERMYAAVDSTVTLSWHLNFRKIGWKEFFTGQLNWKQGNAITYELLDFNATADGELRETKKRSQALLEIPEMKRDSTVEVKIHKIQLKHSGEYTCQLLYNRRYIQSKTELVVMRGERNRSGLGDEEMKKPGRHKSMHRPIFPSSHLPFSYLSSVC